ncbi:hypothetical protein [Mycobacterium sp. E2733]|uniref:hypothetical protein n=1 Tax=Mycobacterium sp. E2733 TaxID=1834138 RepID=UPI0007FBBC57|nr:hypothetical protein [Mycobacterium sp. E2733]OBI00008.1 hypothetical protein A5678_01150 [Mycobacterium sp. E2733]
MEFARRAAVAASKAAQHTIVLALLAVFDQDEFADRPTYPAVNKDSAHPGDPAIPLDLYARDAAIGSLRHELARNLGVNEDKLTFCGEEASATTILLENDRYLLRLDALDGTSNSVAFWTGYSSVVCIDQVRRAEWGLRAHHLAGAIATPQGIISWTNNSRFDHTLRAYPLVQGHVFFEYPQYMAERKVHKRTWSRSADVIAAVAHTEERYKQVLEVAKERGIGTFRRFYTAGGTPLAPALVGGEVGALIEPRNVTLHDSALLIPHQLLGGVTTDLTGEPMNYLALYEANGLELNPNYKPVPGYIAWGGLH